MLEQDGNSTDTFTPRDGQQINYYGNAPYTPIQVDARYGFPTGTELSKRAGFMEYQLGNANTAGRDSLDEHHTPTAVLGQMALQALDRLIDNANKQSFALSVHFNAPHPPMIATGLYFDKYFEARDRLLVPESIRDTMSDSAYINENGRDRISQDDYGYDDEDKIRELNAAYFAMIEEVDIWIGRLLGSLENAGVRDNTLVIFTSDHGEMLGSHALAGKGVLYEEAARVPLLLSFPGKIPENHVIRTPVSHMDVFATILDYVAAGRPDLDQSDGTSLRRFIEQSSFNQFYDEQTVMVEIDKRIPVNGKRFSRSIDSMPNFMLRHGDYKLIIPRAAPSPVMDMMYNLVRME